MPDPYVFAGHTPFMEAALPADPYAAAHARRQPAIGAIASLLSQVGGVPEPSRAEVYDFARKIRDGLAASLKAADAMLAEVGAAYDLLPRPAPAKAPAKPAKPEVPTP